MRNAERDGVGTEEMTSELVAFELDRARLAFVLRELAHEREDLVEVVDGRVADRHFFTKGSGTTCAASN